jgi:hypothetical protein
MSDARLSVQLVNLTDAIAFWLSEFVVRSDREALLPNGVQSLSHLLIICSQFLCP